MEGSALQGADRALLEQSPARSHSLVAGRQASDDAEGAEVFTPHGVGGTLLLASPSSPNSPELPSVAAFGAAAAAAIASAVVGVDAGVDVVSSVVARAVALQSKSGGSRESRPVEESVGAGRADMHLADGEGVCEDCTSEERSNGDDDVDISCVGHDGDGDADDGCGLVTGVLSAVGPASTAAFGTVAPLCGHVGTWTGLAPTGAMEAAMTSASLSAPPAGSRPTSPQALEVEGGAPVAPRILPTSGSGHEPEIATEYCDLEWMASAAKARREHQSSGPPHCKKGHALVPNLLIDHWCDVCALDRRRTMGTSWTCPQGCAFDMCMDCARLPRCSSGHVLRLDPEPRHWCDACRAHGRRTTGTEYRCSMGCDFDLCGPCFEAAERRGVELPAVVEEVFAAESDADAGEEGKADVAAPPRRRRCCRRLMRRFMSRPKRTRMRVGCSLSFSASVLAVVGVLAYDLYYMLRPTDVGPGAYAKYAMPDQLAEDMEVDHIWVRIPDHSESNGNAIFASTQYWLESGVGGYFGTQVWREGTLTTEFAHQGGRREIKRAIFSCWDADEDHKTGWVGENCERFGGEGTGAKCSIPYDFQPGKKYTMRMELEGHRSDGDMWTGYITDAAAGVRTKIGTLLMPSRAPYQGQGKLLTRSAAFLEYFRARGCEDQAFSSVGLIGPYFSNRTIQPLQAFAAYAPDCLTNDVTACIPEYGCGAPRVLMTAGGATRRTSASMQQLWASDESRLYV